MLFNISSDAARDADIFYAVVLFLSGGVVCATRADINARRLLAVS